MQGINQRQILYMQFLKHEVHRGNRAENLEDILLDALALNMYRLEDTK